MAKEFWEYLDEEPPSGPPVQIISHERRRTRDVIKNGRGEKIIVTRRTKARALVLMEDGSKTFMDIPDSTAESNSPEMVNAQKRNRILRRETDLDRNFLPRDLMSS